MTFETWKPRAHFFGELMTDIRGKSNLQKYNEAKINFLKKQEEYALLENADKLETGKADKLVDQLLKLEETANSLRAIKDIPQVSTTCLRRLAREYTKFTTGRERVIAAKQIEKGLLLEEDAITHYSILTGRYNVKNKVRKENEWVSGEIDIEEENEVTDTKVSWDIESFDYVRIFGARHSNEWQARVYCWLWEKPKANIAHILLNTPEHLIVAQERKLMYDMFGSELAKSTAPEEALEAYKEGCNKIRFNSIYDDLPVERKTRIYSIKRDTDVEIAMAKKVEDCRSILANFDKIEVYDTEETKFEN